MSYFGGSSGMQGDPGFFDVFKGIVGVGRRIAGRAFRGSPVGQAIGAIGDLRGRRGATVPAPVIFQPPAFRPGPRRVPAITGGGPVMTVDPVTGEVRRKRRRINYGNTRALRRAVRRTDGFVRIAKTALKNTGFKIVSKSSGKMTEAAWQKRSHHRK